MAGKQKLREEQFTRKKFSLVSGDDAPWNMVDPTRRKFLPTQSAFLHDWDNTYQAYGGGLGNGKTSAGVAKSFFLSTCFPRNCGYIGRWDGKELVQTTMAEFFNNIPSYMYDVNKAMGHVRFKRQYGGSEIYYGDLKEPRGLKNYNLGWFWVDQAEEIDAERWNLLVSRLRRQTTLYHKGQPLRRADGSVIIAPTYGIATFNPEGTASYLYRFFHPDSPEKKEGYKLYQASSFDGMAAGFTSKQYIDDMLAIFPEQARRRYLEGSWEVFEGRVFPQFTRETHVIPPLQPSPRWTYYVSIDHGLSNPTSIGIWGVTPDGIKIRLRSHYEGGGKSVSYHASRLKALTSDLPSPPKLTVMDPACWAKNQSRGDYVFAIVDEYNANGVFPIAGQNNWQAGFNRLNEHLAVDPRLIHPYTGHAGSPRMLICSGGENEHCITEFMNYKWKKAKGTIQRNAPDEPVDHNDHAIDETRYLLSVLPTVIVPEITVAKKDPLAMIAEQRAKWNPLAASVSRSAGSWMSC